MRSMQSRLRWPLPEPFMHPSHTARTLRHTAGTWLSRGVPAIMITVGEVKGSVPRDTGTRMLVSASEVQGTIGGGHLEWQAIDMARQALAECADRAKVALVFKEKPAPSPPTQRHTDHAHGVQPQPAPLPAAWQHTFPLGPRLGQCCGGVVTLHFAPLDDATLQAWQLPLARLHIELHGAGHVGQAIARLLADLDCTVRWIDTREDALEDAPSAQQAPPGLPSRDTIEALPPHIQWLPSDCPEAEVADAPAGACHLVLTHRHDLDLRIIEAVLRRGDAHFAGLIGSQTKRASFLHRLADKGLSAAQLAAMTCPIGLPGLPGKEPAVIAIAVVAQLLQGQPAP
jgi:xanthine dehydrogenase accessory factor